MVEIGSQDMFFTGIMIDVYSPPVGVAFLRNRKVQAQGTAAYKMSLRAAESFQTHLRTIAQRDLLVMETKAIAKKYGADCHHLHHFIFGNDSSSEASKVSDILAHRNAEELKFIRQAYRALYDQDLLQLLSQKTNLLAKVAYLRASEPHDRDAEIIRGSLFGRSLELSILTEIICTRSSPELRIVKGAYQSRYNTDLKQDVSYKVSGVLREILAAVLDSSCYGSARIDSSMAMCDAKTLYEAVGSGRYVDQKSIISILSQRNTSQINVILSSYKQLYGYEFMKFLKKDKCGEFGQHLRVVIGCIQSPEKQFVKHLQAALKAGNGQEALIRIVVSRSGIDVRQINSAFSAKTGWSLESLISNEFNDGFVRNALIALVKHS